jgi:hypothetical protein
MSKRPITPHNNIKGYIDRIIETLVYKGIAVIDNNYFYQVRLGLEGKLRGHVLFHSYLKSRRIFITYKKVKQ